MLVNCITPARVVSICERLTLARTHERDLCAGYTVDCKRAQADQRSLNLSRGKSNAFGQPGAVQDANKYVRPGYMWDQFLTQLECAPVQSKWKTFVTAVTPSWFLSARQQPVAQLVQPADNDDSQPVAINNATWVPVLPAAIAWMMHDAEDRIKNSGIKMSKAQLLARLTSVSYCARDNIKAWNCTRSGHTYQIPTCTHATTSACDGSVESVNLPHSGLHACMLPTLSTFKLHPCTAFSSHIQHVLYTPNTAFCLPQYLS